MEASIGVNLRVTAHSNQGGRKYMEDMFCVAYQPTADDRDLHYAYFGIFDGHGGREAAIYAEKNLMDQIVQQKNFWSDDDELVLKAIHDGFLSTHQAMWKELETWPKTPSGLPSTSGTTASIGFVRRGKLYIGHVGDSGIVMGYEDPETGFWRAKPLTKDHKPESPAETRRINQAGGKVIVKSGVPRVVWNRPRIGHKGPDRRSTLIDEIPFLAVARSLGDLWSYNSKQNEFVVSPEPDVSVVEIDVNSHCCLILGTDGLWNMLTAQDAVNSVYFAEKNNDRQPQPTQGSTDLSKSWINPSKRLVDRALDRWMQHNLRADNTSVVTVVVDPPGPPKRNLVRGVFANPQDPITCPVGISRYVPPQTPYVPPRPEAMQVANNVISPSSSSESLTRPSSPAISHPRVIPRPPKSESNWSITTRCRRKGKSKKKSNRKRRGASSVKTNGPSPDRQDPISPMKIEAKTESPSQAVSASTSRSWRDNTSRASPISTTSSRGNADDIQIHEISSSSESTKSDDHSTLRGKRKAAKKSRSSASKKPRTAPRNEITPVVRRRTRNSVSNTLSKIPPLPLDRIKKSVDLILKDLSPKRPSPKKPSPKSKAKRIPPAPVPPVPIPSLPVAQSKKKETRREPSDRVLRGRIKKTRSPVITVLKCDSERSLRSDTRSSRLRKKK